MWRFEPNRHIGTANTCAVALVTHHIACGKKIRHISSVSHHSFTRFRKLYISIISHSGEHKTNSIQTNLSQTDPLQHLSAFSLYCVFYVNYLRVYLIINKFLFSLLIKFSLSLNHIQFFNYNIFFIHSKNQFYKHIV